MDHKRDGEVRAIGEELAKSQKITARWARELYKKYMDSGEYPC